MSQGVWHTRNLSLWSFPTLFNSNSILSFMQKYLFPITQKTSVMLLVLQCDRGHNCIFFFKIGSHASSKSFVHSHLYLELSTVSLRMDLNCRAEQGPTTPVPRWWWGLGSSCPSLASPHWCKTLWGSPNWGCWQADYACASLPHLQRERDADLQPELIDIHSLNIHPKRERNYIWERVNTVWQGRMRGEGTSENKNLNLPVVLF